MRIAALALAILTTSLSTSAALEIRNVNSMISVTTHVEPHPHTTSSTINAASLLYSAASALESLSHLAATATGSYGSSLRSEVSMLQQTLSREFRSESLGASETGGGSATHRGTGTHTKATVTNSKATGTDTKPPGNTITTSSKTSTASAAAAGGSSGTGKKTASSVQSSTAKSSGMAAETGVPIAMGAVGLAVLAML